MLGTLEVGDWMCLKKGTEDAGGANLEVDMWMGDRVAGVEMTTFLCCNVSAGILQLVVR